MYRGINKNMLIRYIMSGYIGLSQVERLEAQTLESADNYKKIDDDLKKRFIKASKNRLSGIKKQIKLSKEADGFYNSRISWWTNDIRYALTYGDYILCYPLKLKKSQWFYIANGDIPLSECEVYHMPEGGIIKHFTDVDLLKIKKSELKKAINMIPEIEI